MKAYIPILLFLVILLSGCKTKEKALKQDKEENKATIEELKLPQPAIKTANFSKMKVDINFQGNFYSSMASMRILRDSIIQISVQPVLGIEMARVEFYKNELVIIDKMNGRYFKTGYDFLLNNYKVMLDFGSLQGLFLNELFIVGDTDCLYDSLSAKFSKSPFPDGILLKSKSPKTKAPTEFILGNKYHINYAGISMPLTLLTCRYIEFNQKNDVDFPSLLKLSISEGPKTKTADISIQVVEFNMPVKINATNLSNYEQVNTFEQLIP